MLEAFRKLTIESNDVVNLKDEQEKAVLNCLLDGRDVLAVIPTGYGKSIIFQLFATAMAIKKSLRRASFGKCDISNFPANQRSSRSS